MRKWALVIGVLLLPLAGTLLPSADAQEGGTPVIFSRFRHFKIPINLGPGGQERLKQLQLFVSTDMGKSWQPSAVVPPTEANFRFICERDGLYWFAVQSLDKNGKYFPPALDGVAPNLKVLVDTLPPLVTLRPLPPRNGQVGVAWEIKEEYLDFADPNSIRLDYRSAGGPQWISLPINRVATYYYWAPESNGPLEVRIRVQDRAENLTETLTKVGRGDANTETSGLPGNPGGNPTPPPDNPPGGNVPSGQLPAGYATATNRQLINSKRISLNYEVEDVGPSGVSEIELWYTQDGRSWSRYPLPKSQENGKLARPLVFEVSGEGIYGFTLLAKNGVGKGKRPPQIGEPPQIWIEVDLTKPSVQIQNILVSQGVEKGEGKLMIQWTARDKNLGPAPITISYSETADGTWVPIVSHVGNSGRYLWTMPKSLYQFYIRVEAVDRAGNVGFDVTRDLVRVDLSQPKVNILKVEPAGP
jgi:hypothetical protein